MRVHKVVKWFSMLRKKSNTMQLAVLGDQLCRERDCPHLLHVIIGKGHNGNLLVDTVSKELTHRKHIQWRDQERLSPCFFDRAYLRLSASWLAEVFKSLAIVSTMFFE